jgi:hypothetical protein
VICIGYVYRRLCSIAAVAAAIGIAAAAGRSIVSKADKGMAMGSPGAEESAHEGCEQSDDWLPDQKAGEQISDRAATRDRDYVPWKARPDGRLIARLFVTHGRTFALER